MKKWCILRTKENYKEINDWFNKNYDLTLADRKGYVHSWSVYAHSNWCLLDNYGDGKPHPEATIITIEQFRELIKAPVNDNTACEPLLFN